MSADSGTGAGGVDAVGGGCAGQAVIRVCDNGPGLTNPANVFVPFYTTKPEGSGIGLVLAQQIAAGAWGGGGAV